MLYRKYALVSHKQYSYSTEQVFNGNVYLSLNQGVTNSQKLVRNLNHCILHKHFIEFT